MHIQPTSITCGFGGGIILRETPRWARLAIFVRMFLARERIFLARPARSSATGRCRARRSASRRASWRHTPYTSSGSRATSASTRAPILLSLSASAPKAARDAPDAAAAGAAALAPALAQYSPPRVRAQTRRGAAPLPAAPARLPDPGARRLRQLHRAAACAWHQR